MVQEEWTTKARRTLEDPEQWDLEGGEHLSASRKGTSFVVRFSREESAAVYAGARAARVPVYEFLRQAALDQASRLTTSAASDAPATKGRRRSLPQSPEDAIGGSQG
jgi:hypothetical protein